MIGFMDQVDRQNVFDEPVALLLVTTTEPEPVTFTVTTMEHGTTSYTAEYGISTRIEFPADSVTVRDSSDRSKFIRVKAEEGKTISVYGISDEQRSTDGFVALSCDGMELGVPFQRYEYGIVSSAIRPSPSSSLTFSEFLIIPCEDETLIQIVPSQDITITANDFRTLRFGPSENIPSTGRWESSSRQKPRAGATLLISHLNDLTGSIIRSDKPVVVISGHQCAQVPAGNTACDHLVEQVPPTTTWGYTFLLNPLAARKSGDRYRIVTVNDDTEVLVTCADEGTGRNVETEDLGIMSRDPGDNWIEYVTTPACETNFVRRFCSIQASKPVIVAQYSSGYTVDTQCTAVDFPELGDPFMILIPPVVQYINNYTIMAITAVAGSFPERYVSLSVYRDYFQPNEIMMDGAVIEPTASQWNEIYCSDGEVCGYGIYRRFGMGDHTIYHNNPNAGLNVQTYGFQQQNSYGFPAGMEMQPLSGNSHYHMIEKFLNIMISAACFYRDNPDLSRFLSSP